MTWLIILFFGSNCFSIEYLLPKIENEAHVVGRSFFTLEYSEKHEQAKWVYYHVTKENLYNRYYERTDNYRPDPAVSTGSAQLIDYKNSGFDRGHLAPAAVFKFSDEAMSKSFYMSNMSPQRPAFNRGIWKKLEESVRDWARRDEFLHVVTGPALEEYMDKIGPNMVSVPNYFYKVILDYKGPEIKGIGFILPNRKSDAPLHLFAKSIDSLELIVGLDFFPDLPDSIENAVEAKFDPSKWPIYNRVKTKHGHTMEELKAKSRYKKALTEYCKGLTKKGTRCRRKTKDPSGFCWQHK